jgi:NADH dehydrogenase FAD-containing subunit
MSKTILVLGGSYAGLHVTHYLLKQKYPDVKVILVTRVPIPSPTPQSHHLHTLE